MMIFKLPNTETRHGEEAAKGYQTRLKIWLNDLTHNISIWIFTIGQFIFFTLQSTGTYREEGSFNAFTSNKLVNKSKMSFCHIHPSPIAMR